MHEIELTRSLLAQVRELIDGHGGGVVRDICVQTGPLSGVEPELMLSAFEFLRGDASMPNAKLVIEQVPLEACCRVCATVFQPVQFRFRCPNCKSPDTEAVQGDSVILESVSFDPIFSGATVCTE